MKVETFGASRVFIQVPAAGLPLPTKVLFRSSPTRPLLLDRLSHYQASLSLIKRHPNCNASHEDDPHSKIPFHNSYVNPFFDSQHEGQEKILHRLHRFASKSSSSPRLLHYFHSLSDPILHSHSTLIAAEEWILRPRPRVPVGGHAAGGDSSSSFGGCHSKGHCEEWERELPGEGVGGKAWRIDNPCASREELNARYTRRPHAKSLTPNPQWEMVLQQYSTLHRTCMRSVGNLTAHFLSGATTSGCKFLVMEIEGVGLGNKVVLLVSGILYAVLTQRVILLNRNSLIPLTICEPFLGSSWLLDEEFPLPGRQSWDMGVFGRWTSWESPVWKSSKFFESGVDATKSGKTTASASAVKVEFVDPEVKRFYCNTEQAFLTEPTWLHFTGCLYFLPKLFAVPAFRPALEAIFPDPSLTLTYLLRSLMLPRNDVWEQVKQHDRDLFADADHRVGIQVRFLYSRKVYFQSASTRTNNHVKQCLSENHILPTIAELQPPKKRLIQVLVTSLHTSLTEDLLHMYSHHSSVRITQLSHRGKQGFSAEDDHMAMVEILLLSFVDELLVTPLSTFGGLAQAYGATLPWFVEVKRNGKGPCVLAQSVDLCYQTSHSQFDCPHEPSVDGKEVQSLVPYLRTCLPIEESDGVQLVSPNLSH